MTFPEGAWFRFTVAVLATWRVTHLLASEDGPADLVVRVRARLGSGFLGQLADCFQCLSVWVAAPMACAVSARRSTWPVVWLAISGAACLVERIGQAPVLVQPIPEGENDGMLWRETSSSAQSVDAGASAPD
jgi:uncharacterized protein DUF1360